MTVHTYENAVITWPNGERTKVPSLRALAHEAKIGAEEVAKIAAMLRRLRAPRVCWKCYDGRARSHNRRCVRRGHGRDRCAGEERGDEYSDVR